MRQQYVRFHNTSIIHRLYASKFMCQSLTRGRSENQALYQSAQNTKYSIL